MALYSYGPIYSYGPLDVARVDDDRELLARLALEHHYLFFCFFSDGPNGVRGLGRIGRAAVRKGLG